MSREKRKARLLIRACSHSGEVYPHSLLFGVGGTGKTELARCIGSELGYHFIETHAAAFKKRHILFSALIEHSKKAKQRGVPLLFFVDEIHRLSLLLQEGLYQAMKEWWIPTPDGRTEIPPFTLFGATTRFDMLDSNSFVTRFGNVWEIQRYGLDDMAAIVAMELSKHGLSFSSEVSYEVAKRSLGIPRNAVNLANKVRIAAFSQESSEVRLSHCRFMFELEQIDSRGLQPVHHRYLRILEKSRGSGKYLPLGVGAIASKMRQPEDVIKGSVEPILLELDLVSPTPRGRMLTETGSEYLEKLGSENFEKVA